MEKDLRKKFVKDTGIPIKVLESPYFEYFLDLYEPTHGSRTLWEDLKKEVSGKPGEWLEKFRKITDKVISDVTSSGGYKEFNSDKDLDTLLSSSTHPEVHKELYSGANIGGKRFLSIDLKKANFQALRWYCPEIFRSEKTWEDFLGHYIDPGSFIVKSKGLRQILLGKTNPSRIMRVERYLISNIYDLISSLLPEESLLFSRASDEVIWEIQGEDPDCGGIREKIYEKMEIDVKSEIFSLDMIQRFTHSGSSILGFIKNYKYPDSKLSELKGVPGVYYPQIYKAWKGLDLNPTYDLVINYEGEIARFDHALSFTK